MTEASRVQKLLINQNAEIDALKNRVAELEEENRRLRSQGAKTMKVTLDATNIRAELKHKKLKATQKDHLQ